MFQLLNRGSRQCITRSLWLTATLTRASVGSIDPGEGDMDDKDQDHAATDTGISRAGSTLGGAAAGAVAGTALGVPVVGTVIGALSGAAIGAARKGTRKQHERRSRRLHQQRGRAQRQGDRQRRKRSRPTHAKLTSRPKNQCGKPKHPRLHAGHPRPDEGRLAHGS